MRLNTRETRWLHTYNPTTDNFAGRTYAQSSLSARCTFINVCTGTHSPTQCVKRHIEFEVCHVLVRNLGVTLCHNIAEAAWGGDMDYKHSPHKWSSNYL